MRKGGGKIYKKSGKASKKGGDRVFKIRVVYNGGGDWGLFSGVKVRYFGHGII